MNRVPWWAWVALAVVTGVVAWWFARPEYAAVSAIPLEVARRSMARAKRLRVEAATIDAAVEGLSMADRFKAGEQ